MRIAKARRRALPKPVSFLISKWIQNGFVSIKLDYLFTNVNLEYLAASINLDQLLASTTLDHLLASSSSSSNSSSNSRCMYVWVFDGIGDT